MDELGAVKSDEGPANYLWTWGRRYSRALRNQLKDLYFGKKVNVMRLLGGDPPGQQAGEGQEERPAVGPRRPELWEELAQGALQDEDISEVIIKELDLQNQHWQEEVASLQDVEVCNLTIALPLKSRHVSDIIEVTSGGLPLRVHTDRAREFTSKQFSAWLRQRDVVQLVVMSTKAVLELKVKSMCSREELASVACIGSSTMLIPFGSRGMARLKRWHHVKDKDVRQHPTQKVTICGLYDMSPASNGYYVECDGRWVRSTVVVKPRCPEPDRP